MACQRDWLAEIAAAPGEHPEADGLLNLLGTIQDAAEEGYDEDDEVEYPCCTRCGRPMVGDGTGITHHIIGPGVHDTFADADHAAVAPEE